jgi:outer membrane protein TolC/ABC-type uncharacterized transport system substrate-binding protein
MFGKTASILFLLLLLTAGVAFSRTDTVHVAYYEAGSYFMHKIMYREIADALERLSGDSIEVLYEPYAYKTADWDRDKCKTLARDLSRMNDIDLVLAAGPWVIRDLISAEFNKPIIGIYQFDPPTAGLVAPDGRPIYDNLTLIYSPDKLKNDLEMMQRLFPSDRVGLVYFPDENEFNVMVDRIHRISGQFGAAVHAGEGYNNDSLYSFFKAFNSIKASARALYLPPLWGLNNDQIRQFMNVVTRERIPTFTSEGFLVMEKGATAANSTHNYKGQAQFLAFNIIRIIRGEDAGELPIRYDEIPALCLNLETARRVGATFDRNHIGNAKTIEPVHPESTQRYTFRQAIEQSVRENVDIYVYESRVQQALANVRSTSAALYPQAKINISAATTDNEPAAAFYNQRFNRELAAEIGLDQKVFSYPVLKSIHRAKKSLEIARENRQLFINDLKLAVTAAFLNVLQTEEQLQLARSQVDRYREYIVMAAVNNRLGLCDSLDLSMAEVKLVEAKIKSHRLQSELISARRLFNILIGRPGDEQIILDDSEFSTENMVFLARKIEDYTRNDARLEKFEDFLVAAGLENSSGIRIASLEANMIHDSLSAAGRWYLPELSLQLRYAVSEEFAPGVDQRDNYLTFGGRLNFPLFDYRKIVSRRRLLQARLDEIQYRKDRVRFEHYREITDAGERLVTQSQILPMGYYVENTAARNLDGYYAKYLTGDVNFLNLISVAESEFQAQTNRLTNRYKFFEIYSELLNTLGREYLYHGSGNQKAFYDELEQYLNE